MKMKRRVKKDEEEAVTKLTFVFSNYSQLEPAIYMWKEKKKQTHTHVNNSRTKTQHKYASIRFMTVKWIASSFDSEFSSSDSDSDLICVFLRCQTLLRSLIFQWLASISLLNRFRGREESFWSSTLTQSGLEINNK